MTLLSTTPAVAAHKVSVSAGICLPVTKTWKTTRLELDEETTDVDSGLSDAELSCSSVDVASASEAWTDCAKGRRRTALRGRFDPSVLATIPATPITDQSPLLFTSPAGLESSSSEDEATAAFATNPPPSGLLLLESPNRRARAKRDAVSSSTRAPPGLPSPPRASARLRLERPASAVLATDPPKWGSTSRLAGEAPSVSLLPPSPNRRARAKRDAVFFRAPPGLAVPTRAFAPNRGTKVVSAMPGTDAPPCVSVSVSTAGLVLAQAPKRRARTAITAEAKQESFPMKADVREQLEFARTPVNPGLPAKNTPAFPQFAASAMGIAKTGMPVKKEVQHWFATSPVGDAAGPNSTPR